MVVNRLCKEIYLCKSQDHEATVFANLSHSHLLAWMRYPLGNWLLQWAGDITFVKSTDVLVAVEA